MSYILPQHLFHQTEAVPQAAASPNEQNSTLERCHDHVEPGKERTYNAAPLPSGLRVCAYALFPIGTM